MACSVLCAVKINDFNGTSLQDSNGTLFNNFNVTLFENSTWTPFDDVNRTLTATFNWTSTNATDLAAETVIANHTQIIPATTVISLNQTAVWDGNSTLNRSSVSPIIPSTVHGISPGSSSRYNSGTFKLASGNGDRKLGLVDDRKLGLVDDRKLGLVDDEDSTVIIEGSGTAPRNRPTRVTVPLAADGKLSAFSTPARDFNFDSAITISVAPHEPSTVSESTVAPAH